MTKPTADEKQRWNVRWLRRRRRRIAPYPAEAEASESKERDDGCARTSDCRRTSERAWRYLAELDNGLYPAESPVSSTYLSRRDFLTTYVQVCVRSPLFVIEPHVGLKPVDAKLFLYDRFTAINPLQMMVKHVLLGLSSYLQVNTPLPARRTHFARCRCGRAQPEALSPLIERTVGRTFERYAMGIRDSYVLGPSCCASPRPR